MVVLVVDACEGIKDQDMRIFSYAQRMGRGVIWVMNKTDLLDQKAFQEQAQKCASRLGESFPKHSIAWVFDKKGLHRMNSSSCQKCTNPQN